jgi:dephospho-CoA kinase
MIIIGITGSLGAGKGTIVSYLKKKGFKHYSVRSFLINEIKKLKLPISRESMVKVANDLRLKYGVSYIVEQLYSKANSDCIIESIRAIGEVKKLKQKGEFILFAVDANQKTRYERIKKRKSSTDLISFNEFKQQEEKELSNSDPFKQNLVKCMKMADYKFINNGPKKELYKKIDEIINNIKGDINDN